MGEDTRMIDISVIMPVFNSEKYLKEALDSLLEQTFQRFEIICVDDGSIDGSLEILASYSEMDERIRVIMQEHTGAAAARNAGFLHAQGEYVIFLDADDIFGKEMLAKIVQKAKKTKADVILFGAKRYDDRTKEVIYTPWYLKRELLPDKEVFSRKDMDGRVLELTIPSPWTKAFRKQFLVKENLFFQDLPNSNDIYFAMLSLAIAEKITAMKEDLLWYRVFREGSIQDVKDHAPICFLQAYEAVYNELLRRKIYDEVSVGFCNQVISGCVFSLNSVHSEKARWKIIEALSSERFLRLHVLECQKENICEPEKVSMLKGLPYALEVHKKLRKMRIPAQETLIKSATSFTDKKVTVIIPIYNTEPYLKDCMDSILGQTLKDLEIICIDDGSDDQSLQILCEYAGKDDRITVYHQENCGQAVARNKGVKKASGEYVYFMDSDDVLQVDALENLYQRCREEQLDALYFDASVFYENEEIKKQHSQFEGSYSRKGSYPRQCAGLEMFMKMVMLKEYRVIPGIQFFRRDFLEREEILFQSGVVHEDNDFTFRAMLLAKRAGYMKEAYFKRRIRSESTVTEEVNFAHVYGYFKGFLNMLNFVKEKDYPEDVLNVLNITIYNMLENAKKKYADLPDEEKYAAMGLEGIDKLIFRTLVADDAEMYARYHQIDRKLQRTYAEKSEINRTLQITYGEKYDRGLEIKRLKKELASIKTSRSYKLARIIGYPVRFLRRVKKKVRGEM